MVTPTTITYTPDSVTVNNDNGLGFDFNGVLSTYSNEGDQMTDGAIQNQQLFPGAHNVSYDGNNTVIGGLTGTLHMAGAANSSVAYGLDSGNGKIYEFNFTGAPVHVSTMDSTILGQPITAFGGFMDDGVYSGVVSNSVGNASLVDLMTGASTGSFTLSGATNVRDIDMFKSAGQYSASTLAEVGGDKVLNSYNNMTVVPEVGPTALLAIGAAASLLLRNRK